MSPKAATYGFPFIMIHWLMALLIVLFLGLGRYAQSLASESTVRAFLVEVHISLGLTSLTLVTFLCLFRLVIKPLFYGFVYTQNPASSTIKFQLISRIAKYWL